MLSQLGKSLGMLRWRAALLSDRQEPHLGPEPLSVTFELMILTSGYTAKRSCEFSENNKRWTGDQHTPARRKVMTVLDIRVDRNNQ